ncbi:Flp pilus assembly protein CpaB [Sulfitobacter sp. R18_1]|uniref:Flp pilus assembly protein CpaB n=1 Tax=Sulfitobacter sp. R18_1 TaxID=2821104 RepID=UPI0032AF453C
MLVLLTSAVLAVAVTWVSIRPESQPASPSPGEVAVVNEMPSIAVLGASKLILKDTDLSLDLIEGIDIPANFITPDFTLDSEINRKRLSGLRAEREIQAGSPIKTSDLIIPEPPEKPVAQPEKISRFTGDLGAGMRAISVPLSHQTSIGGLIEPNDRIDIMVSYKSQGDVRAVRSILENVRVLALNETGTRSDDGRMMTLELHPEGTKVLALAEQTGELIFVLSPAGDGGQPIIVRDDPMLSTRISGETVDSYTPPPKKRIVTVFRGQGGQKQTAFDAGDQVQSLLKQEAQTGDDLPISR